MTTAWPPSTRLLSAIAIVAMAWAYRALVLGEMAAPSRAVTARWLFAPGQASPLLAVGLAIWLLWRRRGRLARCDDSVSWGFGVALLVPGLALFVWPHYVDFPELLIVALSLQLLGLTAVAKGRAGMRIVLLPALVLLLAVPIPPVLLNELVWYLQIWTTSASSLILSMFGFEVQHADAMIRVGDDHALVVVGACSGLRGIQVLLIVAFVVRELFATAGARAWIAVLVAPVLAAALNAVRVASIALTEAPEVRFSIAPGHLTQGLTVTVAGTVVLYGLGLWVSRGQGASPPPVHHAGEQGRVGRGSSGLAKGIVALYASMLAVLSSLPLAHAASRDGDDPPTVPPPRIALARGGWTGTDLETDWLAIDELPLDPIVHRRYERLAGRDLPQIVDLFVAYHDPSRPTESPFSSKLTRPGAEWSLMERRTVEIWPLELAADLSRARSGSAQAISYHWHLRDDGRARSALHSFIGLDRLGATNGPGRAVVRLSTPLEAAGPLARDQAKRVLDQFIDDFVEDLERL